MSNDILDTIQTRRSIRRYQQRPIPHHLVEQILTMAVWAPSAHNRQPWRFVIITSQSQKETLAHKMGERLRADLHADNLPESVISADVQRSYDRITSAPILILLALSMRDMDAYPDQHREQAEYIMAVQSTAMAGQNILLASHALGLGACWMCAPLFVPALVRKTLDLPADWQPQALITLGYPDQERQRTRQPLETKILWR